MNEQVQTTSGLANIDPESGELIPVQVDEATKYQKLQRWVELKGQIDDFKPVIEEEMKLRKELMGYFFPNAKEGVNSADLQQEWKIKGTAKYDRKIDEAAWPAVREQLMKTGIKADTLVDMRPSLNLTNYRTLVQIDPDSARVFEGALIVKPASPTLELVAPKQKAPSFTNPQG